MKQGRRLLLVAVMVCLVASMPVAWTASLLEGSSVEAFTAPIADPEATVTLCHWGGNWWRARTLHVPESSVKAHLAHGDYLRACWTCASAPKAGKATPTTPTEPCSVEGAAYDLPPASPVSAPEPAALPAARPKGSTLSDR